MSIPGLGDAITLFDLSVRVTTFINDLRHAQDDFISLRSEADCLRICLGSLTSDSCQNALYHYITKKQGRDLKQIIDNCKFNMMDLNNFIAKCAKLGDNSSITVKRKRDFFKKIGKAIGKGFTKYKFIMTDKQAFRDKLVLPTASINVFLTSMTHVGLVNMGKIMIEAGHGIAIPTGAGSDQNKGQKTRDTVTMNPVDGWQAVRRYIAFRDTVVKKSDLTASLEKELLEYALYLIRGGLPFYVKTGGSTAIKHKVTKVTSTRTRTRSRSTGPLGLRKGGRGQNYVMRKKSVSRPSDEKVEIVEREWESGSDSDRPGRRLLAPPASTSSSSSRKYIEIKPGSASASEEGSDHTAHSPKRAYDHGGRSARREEHRRPSAREAEREKPRTQPLTSREQIRARRQDMRQTIRDEQEDAYKELEEEEQTYRMRRAQTRMSRPLFHSRAEEEEYERGEEEDDVIAFLAEQYGVVVEPLPTPREPIDNGTVKDIPPSTASEHIESISDTEDSDSPPTPLLPRHRTMNGRPTNDRLRAQTYRSPTSFMPRSTRYEPYPDPHGPSRYRPDLRPYPSSYDETIRRPHEYRDTLPPIIVDEKQSHLKRHDHDAPIIVDERHSPPPRFPGYPLGHYPHRRSSDESDLGLYDSRGPPRGPGPGPGPSHGYEKEVMIIKADDKVPKHAKRKSALKHRPVVVEQPQSYNDEVRPPHAERERSKSNGQARYASHRYAGAPRDNVDEIYMPDQHRDTRRYIAPEVGHELYMHGARNEDDSDDS